MKLASCDHFREVHFAIKISKIQKMALRASNELEIVKECPKLNGQKQLSAE